MERRILFRLILVSFLSIVVSSTLQSQSASNYHMYVNANFGITQAFCDLQEYNNHISKIPDETEFGYGIKLAKYISPVFAANAQFLRGYLKGSKKSADAKFNADFFEYSLAASVNFSNLFWGINHDRTLYVYGTTGLGLSYFRSEARRISNNNLINDYGYTKDLERSKDKRPNFFVLPIGVGLDFKLGSRWFLNLEMVLKLADTDKIDAVVSGKHNDAYYYTSMGLSYNFWKKKPRERIEVPPEIIAEVEEVDSIIFERVDLEYIIPDNIESNSEFQMKFIVHKGQIDGFGELMQILPIGFNVTDTVIDDARFEFRNYTLNMYWDELPADSVFEITYNVEVEDVYGNLPITSILYFDRTGKEYKFKRSIYIEKERPSVEPDTIPEIVEEPVPEIEFKVQVRAAYKAMIPLQRLANKYHLRDSIREDFVGNWYRYSVGSFETYAEAREYRSVIIKEHKVYDAFVVAFRNGVRLNSLSELQEITPTPFPEDDTKYEETGTVYRVQILALLHNKVTIEALKDIYGITEEVSEEIYGKWRKYIVGEFTSITEANQMQQKMIAKGITDAFIVIYKNGERISVNN
ncbi:MAG: outer membrane beta-barrel protein [Bacteroidales bacterium]|nr:outer membrane beta-barrel protein [Bacteroidales bacterium]